MIDLSRVKYLLDGEITDLVNTLNGLDLEDADSIESQSKSKLRAFRADKTRELLLLESRLTFVAQLVRNEYWFAKGEIDPLDPKRDWDDHAGDDGDDEVMPS